MQGNGVAGTTGFTPARATLRDGRSVTIRPIREDDAAAIESAFAHLSSEARYSRFMAPLRELPSAMLQSGLHPRDDERALVAVPDGPGEEIVGAARYVRGASDETCEFAVTVADDWRGAGLASRMMRELIRDAAARGWKRMEGYVLATNRAMLGLARRLGFEETASEEGASLRLVRLELARVGDVGN